MAIAQAAAFTILSTESLLVYQNHSPSTGLATRQEEGLRTLLRLVVAMDTVVTSREVSSLFFKVFIRTAQGTVSNFQLIETKFFVVISLIKPRLSQEVDFQYFQSRFPPFCDNALSVEFNEQRNSLESRECICSSAGISWPVTRCCEITRCTWYAPSCYRAPTCRWWRWMLLACFWASSRLCRHWGMQLQRPMASKAFPNSTPFW